jgi:hypothetical protein
VFNELGGLLLLKGEWEEKLSWAVETNDSVRKLGR